MEILTKEEKLRELKAQAYDLIANYEAAIGVANQYKESLTNINSQILEIQQDLQEKETK